MDRNISDAFNKLYDALGNLSKWLISENQKLIRANQQLNLRIQNKAFDEAIDKAIDKASDELVDQESE